MDNTQHYIEIQLDVFRHPNGSVYRFCGGWVPARDLESDSESWVVASNSDDGKSRRKSDILVGSEQSCFEHHVVTVLDTVDNLVCAAYRGNPYDLGHPEYNTTDPAGMCFVQSGWYSDDTTVSVSVSGVSGVLSGVVDDDGDGEDVCVAVAVSSSGVVMVGVGDG